MYEKAPLRGLKATTESDSDRAYFLMILAINSLIFCTNLSIKVF